MHEPRAAASEQTPPVALDYAEVQPSPELRRFVVCFWMIASSGPTELRDRTMPDGCQEIIIQPDTTVQRRNKGGRFSINPKVELVGQMTRAYDVITNGRKRFFGIKFRPHGVAPFLGIAQHELNDESIDAQALFGPEFQRAVDEFLTCPNLTRFVASMSAFQVGRLARVRADGSSGLLVAEAVRRIFASQESVLIADLAARLGVGGRRLQVAFKEHVGLSPKQLARMVRFQRTLPSVRDPAVSLTDVAHACGYFDQAHFAHEFAEFAGCSPSAYRTMQTPLTGFFLRPAGLAHLCRVPT